MKIKLLTIFSGPDGSHQPGTELDTELGEISKKEAQDLIDGHYAIELKTRRGEKAVAKKGEHAVLTPTAEDDAREHLARIKDAEEAAALPPAPDSPDDVAAGEDTGKAKPGLLGRMMKSING